MCVCVFVRSKYIHIYIFLLSFKPGYKLKTSKRVIGKNLLSRVRRLSFPFASTVPKLTVNAAPCGHFPWQPLLSYPDSRGLCFPCSFYTTCLGPCLRDCVFWPPH